MKLLDVVTRLAQVLEPLSIGDRERVLKVALDLNKDLYLEVGTTGIVDIKEHRRQKAEDKAKHAAMKRPPKPKTDPDDASPQILAAVKAVNERDGYVSPAEVAKTLRITPAAASQRLIKATNMGLLTNPERGKFEHL